MKKLSLLSLLAILALSTSAQWTTSGSDIYYSTGDVGIGVNPSTFHWANNQLVIGNGVSSNGLTIFSQNNARGRIAFTDANGTSLPGLIDYNHSSNEFRFRVNDADKMFLRNNGDLDLTGGDLDVNGTISGADILLNGQSLSRDWPANTSTYVYFGTPDLTQSQVGNYALLQHKTIGTTYLNSPDKIFFRINNDQKMILDANGRFGIGTTTPVEDFQIGDRWTFHNGGTKIIGYNFDFDGDGKRIVEDEASYIGLTGSGNIEFKTAALGTAGSIITWNNPLFIKNNGNVGIGTSDPGAKLEVKGMVKFDGDNTDDELISKSYAGYRSLEFHKLVFHEWSYGNVLTISGGNVGISNTTPNAALDVLGTIQSSAAAANDALVVKNSGSSGIDFKVKGDGRVFAREVEVTIDAFPDYVFENGYELMSLNDLRNYIQKENHLPGIKSASEIEEEGIGLGELSKIQMEKIEELTLYILQLEENILQLGEKIKELENQ